ncbi:MAG: hypothetical protein RL030_2269 [Pseudomonadota bacterium]
MNNPRVFILFLALLAIPARLPAADSAAILPSSVRPTHYAVSVEPDAAALTFAGKANISVDVLQPTSRITLNAADLGISSVRLAGGPGNAAHAAPTIDLDAAAQTATFHFDRSLPVGSYELVIDYTGKIGTQSAGLFAVDYDTAAGPKRALYTQFQVAHARRFVPSWDEPDFKAVFTLQATVPSTQMAVSNMPVARRTDLGNGLTRVEFQPSPKMSTYLLFLGVGEFDRQVAKAGDTEVGVVTQKGLGSQAAYALESSQRVLNEYNDYFGAPYPLPKLDNVAAPGASQQFSAMENWGAIFTYEYAILLDPAFSTEADRQGAFETAAHEIAHQWFGDLVTMRWWDDLWLNEGFASWLAGRTAEKLHPEWNAPLAAVNSRHGAMNRDALSTTHPVVQVVATAEQANQAFDAISYFKGEAVLRMLEDYVGSDAWRAGVRRYIDSHRYGNTVSQDFWRAIETASGQPIKDIAHDFTLQPGVPMIRVESSECTAGRTKLRLIQGEFSKDYPDRKPLSWRVPVIVSSLDGTQSVRTLVTGGRANVEIEGCGPVIVNAGQSGYYRTLYSPQLFAGITRDFASVKPIDQLGVLLDSWSLGRAGQQPITDYLQLVDKISPRADPKIWQAIASAFREINRLYAGDPVHQAKFQDFARARLAPVFAEIGWIASPGEADVVALLRSDLIATLSTLNDTAVIDEARRRYRTLATDGEAVPAPLRRSVLQVVALHADPATWDALRVAARAEKSPQFKDQLYMLLASPADAALARRALDLALTDEPSVTNSAMMISEASILHPDMAFDFAMENFDAVGERLDASSSSRYYAQLAILSLDPAMKGKIRGYAEAKLPPDLRGESETVVANITDRIATTQQRLPEIDAWLGK